MSKIKSELASAATKVFGYKVVIHDGNKRPYVGGRYQDIHGAKYHAELLCSRLVRSSNKRTVRCCAQEGWRGNKGKTLYCFESRNGGIAVGEDWEGIIGKREVARLKGKKK